MTYYVYDGTTGLLTESVEDVNTSSDPPAAWPTDWTDQNLVTANPDGQYLTTNYEYDAFGRLTQVLAPEHTAIDVNGAATNLRSAVWYAYNDVGTNGNTLNDVGSTNVLSNAGVGAEVWSASGYVVGGSSTVGGR